LVSAVETSGPKKPQEFEGCFVNEEGNFAIEAGISGEGLRMHVNRLPNTYHLQHYHDDIFA
jgi:hypothetical protein